MTRADNHPDRHLVLSDTLERIADLLLSEQTLDAVLAMTADLARSVMPSLDAVGITLVRNGQVVTTSYSDTIALGVDETQYELGEGPCLTSLEEEREVHVASIVDDDRWPRFRRQAQHAGICSILSLPLDAKGRVLGALNLYSRKTNHFTDEHIQTARSFAQKASVLLANAGDYTDALHLNGHLEEALRTRDIIGQAKGILMVTNDCSSDEAFDMLRRMSQEQNVKLREIATRIVDEMTKPHTGA